MVITSIISKLATLVLASSVMAIRINDGNTPGPRPDNSENPAKETAKSEVLFFEIPLCSGTNTPYSSSLVPDGCHTECQELVDNYHSVSIVDSSDETSCYLWQVPGCSGNYTGLARSSPQCTTANSMEIFIRSAWCYRGTCSG